PRGAAPPAHPGPAGLRAAPPPPGRSRTAVPLAAQRRASLRLVTRGVPLRPAPNYAGPSLRDVRVGPVRPASPPAAAGGHRRRASSQAPPRAVRAVSPRWHGGLQTG